MVEPRLTGGDLAAVDGLLAQADAELAARYPGDAGGRRPVHTLYVPADRAAPASARDAGAGALAALAEHAPDPEALADAVGRPVAEVEDVWPRLVAKLDREPVEDLRVDLEDGYGARPDSEEDAHALRAADALAGMLGADGGPAWAGVRVKSLEATSRRRGLRSLDLVLGALCQWGPLPERFVVTLPKVTSVDQVGAMVEVCGRLERAHGLEPGALRFEIQVETPQAVLGADGTATVARAVHAAGGRCAGLHFGTYDYTAALGVAAAHQAMDHPAAEHAKDVMALAAAGTGVPVSDGSTNVLPVGERADVHAAWALHARLVERSLVRGFYQGWDLHPAQLVTRYLATYAFFRRAAPAAAARLRAYLARAESGVLDEPATARALAATLLRGVQCGALDQEEVGLQTGFDRRTLEALVHGPGASGTPRAQA